jgi:hypothetical protein
MYRRDLAWSAGRTEYIGWVDAYYSSPEAVLRVTHPAKYAGFTSRVLPEFLPDGIRALVPPKGLPRFNRKLHRPSHPIPLSAEILISDLPPGYGHSENWEPPAKRVDGWQIRDEFLRLDRSIGSLLSFLKRYGQWDGSTSPRMDPSATRMIPEIVFAEQIWYVRDEREKVSGMQALLDVQKQPKEFRHLQDVIRWGLSSGSARWFRSGYASVDPVGPEPDYPHFLITAETCYNVILATITVDHLRGTKFRTCARGDCRMPFALESRHKRNYCCQYCAHLESVRRNRLKVQAK